MSKKSEVIDKKQKELHDNMNENFKVLRLIYAVSFVVSFRELLKPFKEISCITLEYFIGSIALLFLSIRLLWAVGNIRRFVMEKIPKNLNNNVGANGEYTGYAEHFGLNLWEWFRVMAFDVPILIIHSFLFFILADILVKVNNQVVEGINYNNVYHFIGTYSILLLLNSVWLLTLRTSGKKDFCEYKWMCNNFVAAFVGLLLILIWHILDILPMQALFYTGVFLFFANSIIDYYLAGWAYIIGKPG